MPKNVIYVDWNYGWKTNYFGDIQKLFDAGVTFWGAPSLRSSPDNMYLTSWITHFNNQKDFIPFAGKSDYKGMIMTSWSTSGLYGFSYDQGWEIQDMEQVRNVYPLNGFHMLLEAYSKSISQPEPLNPEQFVTEYAQTRFGLTKEEGNTLWQIISTPQEVVRKGKSPTGISITDMVAQSKKMCDMLYQLSPQKNLTEFSHLKLMFDIRLNYLRFKEIETVYESDSFNRSKAKEFLSKLEVVLAEEKKLDNRFTLLQKGFLTNRGITELNTIRKKKMIVIKDFLSAQLH